VFFGLAQTNESTKLLFQLKVRSGMVFFQVFYTPDAPLRGAGAARFARLNHQLGEGIAELAAFEGWAQGPRPTRACARARHDATAVPAEP
jgi:hypothetical protein